MSHASSAMLLNAILPNLAGGTTRQPEGPVSKPKEPKKSPSERVYDALSKRLEPFSKKLSVEDQTELDGVVSMFAEDVIGAIKTPVFLGKL